MIRKAFYGNNIALTITKDITMNEKIVLGVIVVLIVWLGVYPNAMLHLTNDVSNDNLTKSDISPLFMKK